MAINFKLGRERDVLPEERDPMNRSWVGWDERRSDQAIYEVNRGVWLLGPRAEREQFATFSFDGFVEVVVAVDGFEQVSMPDGRDKKAVVGRVLKPGDPAFEALINRPVDAHRNPVTYIDDVRGGTRMCACGCGEAIASTRVFLPGHDQKAIHERINRQWGSTLGFVNWYDATYPD